MAESTPDEGATKAINYSLKRWTVLIRYLDDCNLPIDNNWLENQMRSSCAALTAA